MRNAVIRLATLCCVVALALGQCFPAAAEDWLLPTRTYDGQVWTARPAADLTTVLLIGFDHYENGIQVEQSNYALGGQADFLLLLVIDHEAGQIHQLQLDRDTMTKIKVYGVLGGYLGTSRRQICLAHAYGDTQEANNDHTVWAVEELLGIAGPKDGAQIDWYMAMNISGLAKLNDALGGVTVPIEDDFSSLDPTMVKGTVMRLEGKQVEYYCRGRQAIGDATNASRMARQRHFMKAAGEVFRERVSQDANFAQQLLDEMGVIYATGKQLDDGFGFTTSDHVGTPAGEQTVNYLMANESLDDIVALIARAVDYASLPIETLPGEHVLGRDGYVQYVLEEGAAERWMMDVFYDPPR